MSPSVLVRNISQARVKQHPWSNLILFKNPIPQSQQVMYHYHRYLQNRIYSKLAAEIKCTVAKCASTKFPPYMDAPEICTI